MLDIHFEVPERERLLNGYPIECFSKVYTYGMCASLHWHRASEIIFVQEGTQDVTAGNHIEHIQKGGLIYINPEQPHLAYSGYKEKTVLTVVKFDPNIIFSRERNEVEEGLFSPFLGSGINQSLAFEAKNLPTRLIEILKDIDVISKEKSYGYEYRTRVLINEFMWILAVTLHERGGNVASSSPISGQEMERFRAVFRYIDENYMSEIPIEVLTDICNLSYSCFAVKFKSFTGKTVVKYINNVRVAQAQKLLISTAGSISEIGESCGFSDICYFSRVFKMISGQSPQEFRKSSR